MVIGSREMEHFFTRSTLAIQLREVNRMPIDIDENQPSSSSPNSSLTGETDEGQFITPDQIQEGFDEIEKYLGADDDNIFENIDNAQVELGRGSAAKYS